MFHLLFHQRFTHFKPMVTLKVVSHNDSLYLQIIQKRKPARLALGIRCTKERLAEAQASPDSRDNVSLMRLLRQKVVKAEDILYRMERELDGMDFTADDVKREIEREWYPDKARRRESANLFLPRFRDYISRCNKPRTAQLYKCTLSRIEALMPEADTLHFEDITPEWLRRFEARLAETSPGANARGIHLRNIRAVVNAAITDGITDYYAFRRFRIRHEATRKRAMPVEDLRRLLTMELDGPDAYYRDMFALMFFLIGINTVDLYALKGMRGDRIEYCRSKTGKHYSIKVEPEAMEIIERHRGVNGLLDIADRWGSSYYFMMQCNHMLKGIGAPRAGRGGRKGEGLWPEISTYWARHTWASVAIDLDIPRETVAHALGHSLNDVTEIYISFNPRKVDEANRRVIDWVLYGKR